MAEVSVYHDGKGLVYRDGCTSYRIPRASTFRICPNREFFQVWAPHIPEFNKKPFYMSIIDKLMGSFA